MLEVPLSSISFVLQKSHKSPSKNKENERQQRVVQYMLAPFRRGRLLLPFYPTIPLLCSFTVSSLYIILRTALALSGWGNDKSYHIRPCRDACPSAMAMERNHWPKHQATHWFGMKYSLELQEPSIYCRKHHPVALG